MLFVDERGEGVVFDGDRSGEDLPDLGSLADDEIQAFLGQLLTRLDFSAERAAAILRAEEAQLAESLRVPLPEGLFEAFEQAAAECIAPEPTPVPRGRVDRSRQA